MLTYAVGDVHGCRDLLVDLLARIDEHGDGRARRLVFLGDYIDRGPDSAGVLRTVMRLQADDPDGVVCLKGNHEELCVRAVEDERRAQHWLVNGGGATLASFGLFDPGDMPPDVLHWMAGRPTFFEDERRCFVHAGLRPGRSPAEQSDEDRLWIREPFLGAEFDFGKFVVHGHTPCRSGVPDLRASRVNLDTAAVFGGPLTAAVFTAERAAPVAFLTARRPLDAPR